MFLTYKGSTSKETSERGETGKGLEGEKGRLRSEGKKAGRETKKVGRKERRLIWLAICFKITTGNAWLFLLRVLVLIHYVWALSPYIRPFRSCTYAFFKGPHI